MIIAFYSYTCSSGKDTATQMAIEWLRESLDLSAQRVGFADEMKIVCADALCVPRHWTREQKIEEIDKLKLDTNFGHVSYARRDDHTDPHSPIATSTGIPGRDFIIGLAGDTSGEFGIRRLDPIFWIRHAFTNVGADVAVVSDMRYFPEGEWVHDRGGKIIELVRPGTQHVNEDRFEPHVIDWTIHNDGDLDDLRLKVHGALDALVQ